MQLRNSCGERPQVRNLPGCVRKTSGLRTQHGRFKRNWNFRCTFYVRWKSLWLRQPLSTGCTQKLLHQQGTSGDCLDLNIALLEKRCQQACGSPAGITFLFEHTLTQRSKSALAWPSTSPWTDNIPVAVCSCFTDLSNPVTALTFVPAERSKNCKSDRDCTFLRYPKIYFNFGCHYDCIASILKIRRVWVCSMQTMPNYTRLHAFA